MKNVILFAVLLFMFAVQSVTAQKLKAITSPNGKIELTVFSSAWGVPGYYVKLDGDTLINDSQLGLRYSGSEITGHAIEKVNYKWERTDSINGVKYNEMIVSFNQPYKGTYKVYARAYDNGIALKQAYSLGSAEKTLLHDDNTTIYFAPKAELVKDAGTMPIDSVKALSFPAEIKLENGKNITFSNTSLKDYPEMELNANTEVSNMLKVGLRPMYKGNDMIKAVLPVTFETPWLKMEIKK